MRIVPVRGRAIAPLAVFGLFALLGCRDALTSQQTEKPEAEKPPVQTAPDTVAAGIQPVLVVASQSGGEAVVELRLRGVKPGTTVASFQGELAYDAGALALRAAQVPQGITGATNEVERGRVRFAGVSLEGIGGGAVLSLRFGATAEVKATDFRITMEELVASEGLENITAQVTRSEHPVLLRSPLSSH